MSHPANALQAGIYNRLSGYSALTSAIGSGKVFDHVPQDTAAPYVLIGDDTLIEADTKTGNGWEATVTIHCWDFEVAGRKSVKTIMGLIFDALHNQESNITVTGFALTFIRREFEDSLQETGEAGATDHYYHGIQRFRALICETNS